ncbi:hypothetical protein H0H87_006527, partial [Tephrocybe sp. NHM501043]
QQYIGIPSNSVGYLNAIKLGFTRSNNIVKTFRHAIALDEHRVKFKQNDWKGLIKETEVPKPAYRPHQKVPRVITDVEEVWFAGCHCDIGGGSVPNGTRPNLAHTPLRWMIRECFKAKTGMIFDEQAVRDCLSLPPSTSATIAVVEPQSWGAYLKSWIPFISPSSNPGVLQVPNNTEEQLDAIDALAPAFDQISLKPPIWSAMKNLPLKKERKDENGVWVEIHERHLSVGRTIPPPEEQRGGKIKVHRTVRLRMESTFESGERKGT